MRPFGRLRNGSPAGPAAAALTLPQAPSHPVSYGALLAALALAGILQPLNMTMLVVGLPGVRDSFDISSSQAAWLITAYIVGVALSQPIAGKLIDGFDRKKVFLIGVAYFGVASVLGGFAWSFPVLLLIRVNQAIGSAIMMPTLVAIVRAEFPQSRRGGAMGIIFSSFAVASMVAPSLGGLLTSTVGWRGMFLINAPLVAAAVFFGMRTVPSRLAPARTSLPFDYTGAVTLTVGLLGLILFASFVSEGYNPVMLAALATGGVLFMAVFIRHESKAADPLVNMALFRIRSFAFASLNQGLASAGMIVQFIGISLYLTDIRGLNPRDTGLVMTAPAVVMLVMAPLGGRFADRVGRRIPMVIGTGLLTVGLVMLALASESTPIWVVVVAMLVNGFGSALEMPSAQTAAVEACSEAQAGMAAGVSATLRSVGSVLGAAIIGGLAGSAISGFHVAFMIGGGMLALAIPLALGVHAHAREGPLPRSLPSARRDADS